VGAGLLLIGLLPAMGSILMQMETIQDHLPASRGMGYALLSGSAVVVLGVVLAGVRSGWWEIASYWELRSAHLGYGLAGWIALLIISVSFQVIEMFYVTPAYPKTITRYLTRTVAWLLIGLLISGIVSPIAQVPFALILLILLGIHAAVTLRRLSQRKRPVTDATVWFWRIGSGALIGSMLLGLWVLTDTAPAWVTSMGAVLFLFFGTSILFAMSYKIVPFLVWFHLSSQGYYTAPMMHEVIHPTYATKHLWIHLATFGSALGGFGMETLWPIAGLGMALSFGWLGVGIYRAWTLYRHVERTGERLAFPDVQQSIS
jgi:hypothetical protein